MATPTSFSLTGRCYLGGWALSWGQALCTVVVLGLEEAGCRRLFPWSRARSALLQIGPRQGVVGGKDSVSLESPRMDWGRFRGTPRAGAFNSKEVPMQEACGKTPKHAGLDRGLRCDL